MANISELSAIIPSKLPKTYEVIKTIQQRYDFTETTQERQDRLRVKMVCMPSVDLFRLTISSIQRTDCGINPFDLNLPVYETTCIPPKVTKLLATATLALRMTGNNEIDKSEHPHEPEPFSTQKSVPDAFGDYVGRSHYISPTLTLSSDPFWNSVHFNTISNKDVFEAFKGPRSNVNHIRLAAVTLLGLLRAEHRVARIPMATTDLDEYLETFSSDPLLFN